MSSKREREDEGDKIEGKPESINSKRVKLDIDDEFDEAFIITAADQNDDEEELTKENGGESSEDETVEIKSEINGVDVDGEDETNDAGPKKKLRDSSLKFGVVCSSNMNRSMEAHRQFQRKGLEVYSYGVGQRIRLPGPSGQNVFEFGTTYQAIKDSLVSTGDEEWYRERGLLGMVERNIRIKDGPERFQECSNQEVVQLDIVFCFEGRVFDLLVEDLDGREPQNFEPIHVLNLEVKDTPEEAEIGARIALELCENLQKRARDLENAVPGVVQDIEEKYGRDIILKTCYL